MSTNSPKRDNDYFLRRLRKDGHDQLLERVEAGEITVYRATQLAGYRKKSASSPAARLSHHWKRASHEERRRFVMAHPFEIDRVLKEIARDARERKAKKTSK